MLLREVEVFVPGIFYSFALFTFPLTVYLTVERSILYFWPFWYLNNSSTRFFTNLHLLVSEQASLTNLLVQANDTSKSDVSFPRSFEQLLIVEILLQALLYSLHKCSSDHASTACDCMDPVVYYSFLHRAVLIYPTTYVSFFFTTSNYFFGNRYPQNGCLFHWNQHHFTWKLFAVPKLNCWGLEAYLPTLFLTKKILVGNHPNPDRGGRS